MATKIILKKSSVSGRIPDQSTLDYGELALNYTDGVLYYKNSSNIVQSISGGLDSDLTLQLVESSYSAIDASLIPSVDSTYDLGAPDKKWKELYLSGNTIHLGDAKISADESGNIAVKDNNGQLRKLVVDEIEVGSGNNKIKLVGNNGRLKVADADNDTTSTVDLSASTTDNLSEGLNNLYFTNSRVTNLITSDYIQSRQIRGADSSWVTGQINDLIGAAPGALDTLAELATAIGDDANFSTTVTNLIASMPDSAYVASYVSSQLPRYGTDYVDSSYVNSQIAAQDLFDGSFAADEKLEFAPELVTGATYTRGSSLDGYVTYSSATNGVLANITTSVVSSLSVGDYVWLYQASYPAPCDAAFEITQIVSSSSIKVNTTSVDGNTNLPGPTQFAMYQVAIEGTTEAPFKIYYNSSAEKIKFDATKTIDVSGDINLGSNSIYAGNLTVTDSTGVNALVNAGLATLADVASSGAYSDLSGTPTDVSTFTNDAGYITNVSEVDSAYVQARQDFAYSSLTGTPTNISTFTNDVGYITGISFDSVTDKPTTIAGYGITDAFDGAYSSLTGTPTILTPAIISNGETPSLASGINAEEIRNLIGAIGSVGLTVPTGLVVSNSPLTSNGSIDITFASGYSIPSNSQKAQWNSAYSWGNHANAGYLTGETTTSLSLTANTLKYIDETGATTNIDLSLYLDDTNLARIASGTIDSSGLATFTRDDASTFNVDFSILLDNTNLTRITSATFNNTDGILTLTRSDNTTVTVDLDGRYALSTDVFSGSYNDLTDTPTLFSGSYNDLTDLPSLFDGAYSSLTGVPTTVSSFTNDAGYITDYTVTEADVTTHEAALTITESQISDLGSYLTSSDVTTLVDSAYVSARVDTGVDSAAITAMIDSDYILSRSTSVEIYDAYDSFISRHQLKLKADVQNGHVVVVGQIEVLDSVGAPSLTDISFHNPGGVGSIDSAGTALIVTATVDSNYIQSRLDGTYTAARDYVTYVYTPTSYTSQFSGEDDNGNTLAYTRGKVEAYVNGVKLVSGIDYTETNSSTITLLEPIADGDTLEIVSLATVVFDDSHIKAVDSSYTTTTVDQILDSFAKTQYRTSKYLVDISCGNKYHSEEILLTHNNSTVGMITYAQILMDSNLGTFDADINNGIVRLKFSPTYSNTVVKTKVIRTDA